MAPDKEKQDPESGSSNNETAVADPSPYAERGEKDYSDNGYPDSEHEEVEAMDAGHQQDLRRSSTTGSIRPGPSRSATGIDGLERTATGASSKSRVTRILSRITTKNKETMEHTKVPEMDLDHGIVGWEGQNDPDMPLNFAPRRKWFILGLVASITFLAPLASSMFAPGVQFMDNEFGNKSTILSAFTVSVFVLGFAIGPLFLSPLSEIYGRRPILGIANCFFAVWEIGCALAPNLSALIVFRLLAGIGGSGCLTIGGGVIADMFHPEQRGFATAMYSLGPLFGPVLGPICGGFIAQRAGWRWVFWVLLIASTLVTIGIELTNKETNPRILIQRKIKRLEKELNRSDLHSCYDPHDAVPRSKAAVIRHGILRPLKMFFFSPIVFLLSIYMALVYGLLYLLFTTITVVFMSTYGWQPEICGLAYLGIGFGFFLGLAVVARLSDSTIVRMTKANNGVFEPEMRLPACVFFACFIPISFFWYGWSAYYKTHWIVPIIGLLPFGFGMMGIFIPIQTYLIDSFPMYAASAVAALAFSRSLFGAFLPLAGPSMYATLGLGWGNSLLGFIALGLIPAPALIYRFGGRIRKNHPIKL